jgi:DNA polymerase-3 subunit alpha
MKVKSLKVRKFFTDMPDIDTDFATFGRDKVKEYISKKYGKNYSCSVGSYTKMKLKTCIKDFAKIKGIPFDLTNKITKDIDDQIEYTWGDLIEYASKSKLLYKFVQDNPDIVHMTKYAMMVPKAESIHPSAYIIVPKHNQDGEKTDLFNLMPVKKIDGVLVSEWEGKYTEAGLFLKEDILGLSQLDKFHGIINLIKKNYGKDIILNDIKFDDVEVFKYFRRGWCEDVFQFGTTGLMGYCRQVKPTQLSDLIAMTALFRPGPMESNAHQDFADIKNGKKKPKYDYGIKNITEETYSLLVYQEQMMSIIHQLGGLSLIEAENARKYIKKKKHKELNELGDRFIAGAIKNGCPEKEAHKIWDKMNAFSSYSFNKSHAAAYSVISYYSMWFKVNYPLEFWTISLQEAAESEIPYRLAEMKKTGVEIEVRPPDVNYSGEKFTCDPENNRIFYNLNKIKGCGDVAVHNIVETRDKDGEFFDLEEFVKRVPSKVNKSNIKNLIISGAFDLIEDLSEPRDRKELLRKFLVDIKGDDDLPEEYKTADSFTNAFWIMEQKRLTGFGEIDYDTLVRDSIPNKRFAKMLVNDVEFLGTREGESVSVAGKLIYYRERAIKSGVMGNLQIDCNNTIINITMWPDAYERYRNEIEDYKNGIIAVSGIVKKDKFKGVKTLYSCDSTKLYLISQRNMKKNVFEKKYGNAEHK